MEQLGMGSSDWLYQPEQLAGRLMAVKATYQGGFFTVRNPVTHSLSTHITQSDYLDGYVDVLGREHTDMLERAYEHAQSTQKYRHDIFCEPDGTAWITGRNFLNQPVLERLHDIHEKPNHETMYDTPDIIYWNEGLTLRAVENAAKLRKQERRKQAVHAIAGATLGILTLPSLLSALHPSSSDTISPTPTVASVPSSKPKATKTPSPDQPSPSTEPSSSKQPDPMPEQETMTLSVATWNMLYKNSNKKVAAGIKTLFETNGNDIVGLQEAVSITKRVLSKTACESEAKTCKHTLTMYPGANGGSATRDQIVWRTNRFSFVKGDTIHAASDPDIHNRHFKHQRYINWVRLTDKTTKQDVYFIDVHAPNGIESNGSPNKKHMNSVKAFKKYTQKLVETIKTLQKDGIPIILVGDFNVNFRADKCATVFFPCRSIDPLMENMWVIADINGNNSKLSTQGNTKRIIDRAYYSETNAVKMKIVEAYVGTHDGKMSGGDKGSDHKPVNVVFEMEITNKQTGSKKTGSFSLTLDGVKNFRDAAATSNGSMAKGVLYRSAKLEDATPSDINKIVALLGKSGTIIDLRTKTVQTKQPDPKIPGIKRSEIYIDGASSAETYKNVFVKTSDRLQMGAALKEFANSEGPTLVHCTAGKDRTGWFTWVVQYINAIEDGQPADAKAEAAIEKQIKTSAMREYLRSNQSGGAVRAAWVEAAMQELMKKYGTFESYVKDGLGLSDEDMAKIARKI